MVRPINSPEAKIVQSQVLDYLTLMTRSKAADRAQAAKHLADYVKAWPESEAKAPAKNPQNVLRFPGQHKAEDQEPQAACFSKRPDAPGAGSPARSEPPLKDA